MEISQIAIYCGGLLSLGMFFFHTRFYSLFGWKDDFEKISYRNKRIFYTIHIALLLLFLLFAFLSFVYTDELARSTGLAFGLNLAISIFWLWRTVWQVVYLKSPKHAIHKKKPAIHYVVILVFFMLFLSYLIPVLLSFI